MRSDIDTADQRRSAPVIDSRVTLALERTLLAWTRTALALMGFGFVVARLPALLGEPAPAPSTTVSSGISPGIVIVTVGIALQIIALFAHTHHVRRIRRGKELELRVISPASIVGAVLVAVGVLVSVYLSWK